jgi:enoyl-CoA hydratase/carnithine racemase
MARLPRLVGRERALEVLLSADDIRGADAELFGYVNRATRWRVRRLRRRARDSDRLIRQVGHRQHQMACE